MTFSKPNISYTEMAMYVDDNARSKNDEETVYQYIYHIIYMLAYQSKYFYRYQDYDDFAVFASSIVYMRLIDDKQGPIKSCLNYIKSIIYALKVQYQKQFWPESQNVSMSPSSNLSYVIDEYTNELNKSEFRLCLESVDNIIKSYIQKLPKKKDSFTQKNIYLSVMLTILSYITLTEEEKAGLLNRPIDSNVINRLYSNKRNGNVILYHLSDEYKDIVKIATNRSMKLLANALSMSTHTYNTTNITAANLLISAMGETSWA